MKYKRGYSFDAVSLEALIRLAEVKDGKVVFSGGSSYNLVVLPKLDRMTVKALNKLENLVQMGARIMGNPPHKSPSLVNFPNNDRSSENSNAVVGPKKHRSITVHDILEKEQSFGGRICMESNRPTIILSQLRNNKLYSSIVGCW